MQPLYRRGRYLPLPLCARTCAVRLYPSRGGSRHGGGRSGELASRRGAGDASSCRELQEASQETAEDFATKINKNLPSRRGQSEEKRKKSAEDEEKSLDRYSYDVQDINLPKMNLGI